jgi:hypothetical protein
MTINLNEAFEDSPIFRGQVSESERYCSFLDDLVKNVVRAAGAVSQAQEVLRAAEDDLAACLKKLGTVYDDQNASLADSLEDFARSVSSLARSRESFVMQVEEAFLQPLAEYETNVVEGTTKKLAKEHAAARETHEKALQKYLGKAPNTPDEVISETAAEVAETNYERHRQALRYGRHLNERESRQKFEIIDHLLVLLFSYASFHHAAHEMLSESKSAMDQVSRKLQLAKQQISSQQNDEQVESKYLSAALSRWAKLRPTGLCFIGRLTTGIVSRNKGTIRKHLISFSLLRRLRHKNLDTCSNVPCRLSGMLGALGTGAGSCAMLPAPRCITFDRKAPMRIRTSLI